MTHPNIFERVYAVVRRIPPGRVTTYGAIARHLGSPQGARLVGWALNATRRHPGWIPAHRVVNRNGLLTGRRHFPGTQTMRELLAAEGIAVADDRVVDFPRIFWDPAQALGAG